MRRGVLGADGKRDMLGMNCFIKRSKFTCFFNWNIPSSLCWRLTSVEASPFLSAFQCFELIRLPPTPPAACLVLMQGEGELRSSDSELKAEGFP